MWLLLILITSEFTIYVHNNTEKFLHVELQWKIVRNMLLNREKNLIN